MATTTHTTASPGGDPPRLPSRRALFASAAALPVLAPMLPARAAAEPDAELLHLAATIRATEARLNARDLVPDEEADAEAVKLSQLKARMVAIPAAGLAGIAAKAGLACAAILAGESDNAGALADSLLADFTRLAPAAVAPGHAVPAATADAAVIGAAAGILASRAASEALVSPYVRLVRFELPPGHLEKLEDLQAEEEGLAERLARLPATSFAGWQAKARAALVLLEPDAESPLAISLCRDLVGMNGGAA